MKKILLIHGPNLDLLGEREAGIYGTTTLAEINLRLTELAQARGIELSVLQSNHEGEIIDAIGRAKSEGVQAIVINPAAYTHTSVAIRDAILGVELPAVEVHLSNIYRREDFRHTSLTAAACVGQITGFGPYSYELGLLAAIQQLKG